jgi:hypothetical protein
MKAAAVKVKKGVTAKVTNINTAKKPVRMDAAADNRSFFYSENQ